MTVEREGVTKATDQKVAFTPTHTLPTHQQSKAHTTPKNQKEQRSKKDKTPIG